MKSDLIRKKYLDFFASKKHKIVPSDSLVPQNDPSVLFTSAGMNQFKEQFMGNITDFRRATSAQKCLRTGDLSNVGKSPTHHTFFEMLGNFSFGDYFKKEAIAWAWEFVTKELGLPEEKLWVSVHKNDEQAYNIWINDIGINAARLVRLGDKDNFWPANAPQDGPNGPCGPCSEIFFDWGADTGCRQPGCSPACDCKRFFEIWNLVFTQYDRQSDGTLLPLPSQNIDTGMGLERVASVMQNVRTNYQTDLFVPIIDALKILIDRAGASVDGSWLDLQAKAVSDHIRAAVFCIGDGVVPSNESRGYVVRKLIRRSIIYLKQSGINKPLCFDLVYAIAKVMESAYPEIMRRHEHIAGVIKQEEEMFWKILRERSQENETQFKQYRLNRQAQNLTPAEIAFNQYDTYGVPLEISRENAAKHGLEISEDEFEKLMEEQRVRSRGGTQISSEIFTKSVANLVKDLKSEFTGYEELETTARVIALLQADMLTNEVASDAVGARAQIDVVLDRTPFYVESGGQVGDKGRIILPDGGVFDVEETRKVHEVILHRGIMTRGKIKTGDAVTARVIDLPRMATARNHTATHLLQYVLRKKLGDKVEQSGSYVGPDRLRFDFSHLKPLSKQIIAEIEAEVNTLILENAGVCPQAMPVEEAKKTKALAFFGEKYGNVVRVLSIGGYSQEFCGGTHVRSTGEIGLFKIVSEGSIAQGVRRIEAVTGTEALAWINQKENLLSELSGIFRTSADNLIDAAKKAQERLKLLERELQKFKSGTLAQEAQALADKAVCLKDDIRFVGAELADYDMNMLRQACDVIRQKIDPVICVLGSGADQKAVLIVAVSNSLVQNGVDAVAIIKSVSGGGGGRKELAQSGVKDRQSLIDAINNSRKLVSEMLGK